MGKKGGSNGGEKEDKARAFVLKVAMHCNCDGCTDKIRAAVKDITLLQGIESWDQSELETKGELKLLATADPEKLRHRLHKATRKNVELIFFPNPKGNKDGGNSNSSSKQAPGSGTDAAQALLLSSLLQQQQGQNAWATNNQNQGVAWNTHGDYAYAPWAVHQQLPDPYAASYSAAWGAHAYPPAQGNGSAWHGLGYC